MLNKILSEYQSLITEHKELNISFRITLSKPRQKEYIKAVISPILTKAEVQAKVELFSKTQSFTRIIEIVDLGKHLEKELTESFYFLDFQSDTHIGWIKQSTKGKITNQLKNQKVEVKQEISSHNRVKSYLISEARPYLQDLGVASSVGKINADAQRKFRQINKFVELVSHYTKDLDIRNVVDMGCGKGYLTFALYDYFNQLNENIKVTGYELRPDLVEKCNKIADKYNYSGLSFQMANIQDAQIGEVDMLVALHACDIATDMAIAKGIKSDAKVMILSPCCHKQIRKEITIKDTITQHGIYLERQAEMITDTIRALILESKGYKTNIIEYISSEHTAKNTMIIAVKGHKNPKALDDIKRLKDQYGIGHHALEGMVLAPSHF